MYGNNNIETWNENCVENITKHLVKEFRIISKAEDTKEDDNYNCVVYISILRSFLGIWTKLSKHPYSQTSHIPGTIVSEIFNHSRNILDYDFLYLQLGKLSTNDNICVIVFFHPKYLFTCSAALLLFEYNLHRASQRKIRTQVFLWAHNKKYLDSSILFFKYNFRAWFHSGIFNT